MQEIAFQRLQISKFSAGVCPSTSLKGSRAIGARMSYRTNLSYNLQ